LGKVTKPRVSSELASVKTVRRRSFEVSKHRDAVSGGSGLIQMADEVRILQREERQQLLKDADVKIIVPALDGLAMKADLTLPWNKLRSMRRYTKQFNSS